ncbi:MAG: hypothetical protein JW753_11470 [Dehalococcoidia bacterium]|nr:hypothetical protein [Dehalococcoidia bacterium]
MEDLRVFFTASGLLAAVLALWVRFWTERGLLGKAWCFCATLVLLLGMGLAALANLTTGNGEAPRMSIGLLMAGLCMTAIAVGESGLHAVYDSWLFMRGKRPVARLVPELDIDLAKPDDIKKNEGVRRFYVLWPAVCGVFLILGFVLYSCGGFTRESLVFYILAVSCFAIAFFALVRTSFALVKRFFFTRDS